MRMNSASTVDNLISQWKSMGLSKEEIVVKTAEACMGWSYVWGGYGQYCTASNRESYANRSTCPSGESEQIKRKCQVLNGSKSSCSGCRYYPSARTRFFDCRGFTRWVLQQVGINLQGAGATSQWNTATNWEIKGKIESMPLDKVCCVFMQNGNTMSHTGLHIGGGNIIHCSGEVKRGKTTDRGWTHFGVPRGLGGDVPVPTTTPTLRKGSTGPYVVECQTDLIRLGYDVGATGADGKYGTKTENAVKLFQSTHFNEFGQKLKVDGICGNDTWWALDNAVVPSVLYTVTIPHLSKEVAEDLVNKYGGSMVAEG